MTLCTDEQVLAVVAVQLAQAGVSGAIGIGTNLWESGMDSLVSVDVMVSVETEFHMEFPDELLTRDNFASVHNIAAAVRQVLGAAA